MSEQKWKHLRKIELLELLLAQTRRVEELERQLELREQELCQARDLTAACRKVERLCQRAEQFFGEVKDGEDCEEAAV